MLMRRKIRRTKKAGVSRKRSTGRRKIGALTASSLVDAVTGIAGAVASRVIVNQLAKSNVGGQFLQKPGNKALIQIGLGVLTPMISKNPIAANFGKGMVYGGGFEFFKTLAPSYLGAADDSEVIVISGMDEIGAMDVLGANEISEINGVDEIAEINGMDEYDYNY